MFGWGCLSIDLWIVFENILIKYAINLRTRDRSEWRSWTRRGQLTMDVIHIPKLSCYWANHKTLIDGLAIRVDLTPGNWWRTACVLLNYVFLTVCLRGGATVTINRPPSVSVRACLTASGGGGNVLHHSITNSARTTTKHQGGRDKFQFPSTNIIYELNFYYILWIW